MFTDITAQKETEEALRKSERRLSLAQRIAHIGDWEWKVDSGNTFWSDEVYHIFGLEPGASKPSYELAREHTHPDDQELWQQAVQAALDAHDWFSLDYRGRRADGSLVWIHNEAQVIRDAQGRTCKMVGTAQDITARKQAEEALRQSQARLQLALEYAQAGLWEWHLWDNTVYWSQEIWHLSGLDPHTHKPSYEAWLQTVSPADLPEVEHKLQEAATKGTELNLEWRTYFPDGVERWLMSRGRPCRDSNGQISSYLGISLDITERKQAEQDLQESRERLHFLASQLLTAQEQERKRLALELHDELGHALLILKFSLSDIAQKLPPEQKDLKHQLQEQLEYIKHVIQEVRRLYRNLSPGDVENLGLTRALKSLIEDFAGHLPGIAWQVDLPELTRSFSLPVQTMIYRLVQEALTNIGKYAEPTQVRILAREKKGCLCLVIEDNGHGFDLSEADRDPARGLGLAAMRERLNIIGGSFEIRSQKGQGTSLTFTIPALSKDA
jgi:PAS domain S-box-containing protein